MDSVGLLAWILNTSMHDAVDVLNGRTQATYTPASATATLAHPAHTTNTPPAPNAENSLEWRQNAAQRIQADVARLLTHTSDGAQAARDYLGRRGLTRETWTQFELGYSKAHVGDGVYVPAISWPVRHESTNEVWAVRYRILPPGDATLRYTSLVGSRMVGGRLFGAQHMWADRTAPYRCLFVCEGEFNAMSIWQLANTHGVDVLSFGSEAQSAIPAWGVDVAGRYGCVVVWMDSPKKAAGVTVQLPQARLLQSPLTADGQKQDANFCLTSGTLGIVVTMARLRTLPNDNERRGVLYQLMDVRDAGIALDAGTVQVAQKVAGELGMVW